VCLLCLPCATTSDKTPQFCRMLGVEPPSLITWMQANKLMAGVGVMFMSQVGVALRSTGAFEVELLSPPEVLFSKLKSGFAPRVEVRPHGRAVGFSPASSESPNWCCCHRTPSSRWWRRASSHVQTTWN
jgi:hypothetical protein